MEDTKQELAISRKAELTLESKHRKLKSRYGNYFFYLFKFCTRKETKVSVFLTRLYIKETVCSAYERLKLSQQEFGGPDNLSWLRESNEKLRKDVLKVNISSFSLL